MFQNEDSTKASNGRILRIRDLAVEFDTPAGVVSALRGISLEVPHGKTVALLGESGCGKSLTGLSILNLIDEPGRISAGQIFFQSKDGRTEDLAGLKEGSRRLKQVRGAEISMIFQDARNSLTPVYTVGEQIAEMLVAHEGISTKSAWKRAVEALAEVGIPAPERRIHEYPYQLSGGMCQRAMIAMALSCRPRLLIADEPTTALDVTIQAQVLDLLRDMQDKHQMSILIITHDMGVVAEVADLVSIMYLGKIVESGPVERIFSNPLHPYTQGLFASVPRPDSNPEESLPRIAGSVPDLIHTPIGCPFRGRCIHEMPECREMPPIKEIEAGHHAACWLHGASPAQAGAGT